MIADTPPAIVLYVRRWKEARDARRMKRVALNGAALSVEENPQFLSPSGHPPEDQTALSALPPPSSPPSDILALPDRDHERTVVPDYAHLEYGE